MATSGSPSTLHAFAAVVADAGVMSRRELESFLSEKGAESEIEIERAVHAVNVALHFALEGLKQDGLSEQSANLADLEPIKGQESARALRDEAHKVAVGLVFEAKSFDHSPSKPIGFVDRAAENVLEAFEALEVREMLKANYLAAASADYAAAGLLAAKAGKKNLLLILQEMKSIEVALEAPNC